MWLAEQSLFLRDSQHTGRGAGTVMQKGSAGHTRTRLAPGGLPEGRGHFVSDVLPTVRAFVVDST